MYLTSLGDNSDLEADGAEEGNGWERAARDAWKNTSDSEAEMYTHHGHIKKNHM